MRDRTKSEFDWSSCKNTDKGSLLEIHVCDPGNGWEHFNKKASEKATYKQLYDAARMIADKLTKQKKEYIISGWLSGDLKFQHRSKLFSN
jgi:hypothetical protein